MTKTALVTGGARGIGRACALALADSGFDIALVDLLEREMASTARDIEARGLGKERSSDEDILQLLQKMIKQRNDSIEAFDKALSGAAEKS